MLMKRLHGYLMIYSAASRILWPQHCARTGESGPVVTMALPVIAQLLNLIEVPVLSGFSFLAPCHPQ